MPSLLATSPCVRSSPNCGRDAWSTWCDCDQILVEPRGLAVEDYLQLGLEDLARDPSRRGNAVAVAGIQRRPVPEPLRVIVVQHDFELLRREADRILPRAQAVLDGRLAMGRKDRQSVSVRRSPEQREQLVPQCLIRVREKRAAPDQVEDAEVERGGIL